MKIVLIVPLPDDDRKIDPVKTSIELPTPDTKTSEFLIETSDMILSVMRENSVHRVKIAFGNDLPEMQVCANISPLPDNEDWTRRIISAALISAIRGLNNISG